MKYGYAATESPTLHLCLLMAGCLLTVLCVFTSCSAAAQPESSGLRLLSAYYMPDPKPPADSHQVEGVSKPREWGCVFAPLQRLYREHDEFGGARVVFRNDSDSPVNIKQIRLNGTPIEDHYVDFLDGKWDDRGIVWYRLRPERIAPGQCAELYIRFRKHPEGTQAIITLHSADGRSLEAAIEYDDPRIVLDYITTDASQKRLYVYVRRSDTAAGNLKSIELDGKPVKDVSFYGANFPGNIALAILDLNDPMKVADYHVVSATTDKGEAVAAQFRVLPFFFMRHSWRFNPQTPQEVRETGMNFIENPIGLADAKRLNLYAAAGYHTKKPHKRMILESMYDEPDAQDIHPQYIEKHKKELKAKGVKYDPEGLAVGLGWHARELVSAEGRFKHNEKHRPGIITWIITNGTTRPLNWFVYGQLADIACTDPYPANVYGADWTTPREQYQLMHKACTPRRMYTCLETYEFRPANPDADMRGPSGKEFRQASTQAIGCGAKGITSWFWSSGSGMFGVKYLPDVYPEYIRMNKLIERIETELLIGTPIDIVTNDAGLTQAGSWVFYEDGPYKLEYPWMKEKVWTGALLCGRDAIVIAAVNHIPAARTKPRRVAPARNVNITVQLPDYLQDVECFEVTDKGFTPQVCQVEDSKALIALDSIETGRIFILRHKH